MKEGKGKQNKYGMWIGVCHKGISLECPKCGCCDNTKMMTIYEADDDYGVFHINLDWLKHLKGYELYCFECKELVGYDFSKEHPLG